nr:DUF368 domain-containing protein [Haladaptatus sp. W1]
MVGALVGLLTISKVVAWALEHYRAATLTFLVSLMVGALRFPVEKTVARVDVRVDADGHRRGARRRPRRRRRGAVARPHHRRFGLLTVRFFDNNYC